MIILTLRTDKPEAEIAIYDGNRQIAAKSWHAHRALAETLHKTIAELLATQQLQLQDVAAIACYKGPGSFTGLRIGLTVANSLAFALQIPVVAETGDDWQLKAIRKLENGESDKLALPEYGAEVHITVPKK